MVHSESPPIIRYFRQDKVLLLQQKKPPRTCTLSIPLYFSAYSIDDLKTVTVSVTVLFTGFIFSIRDSQVILIAGVFTFNKQKNFPLNGDSAG